jgi:RES domain-containing protein
MKLRAYRIVQKQYVSTAFTGEGAAENPGRWNYLEDRVVYCSSTLSLALLEQLVRIRKVQFLRIYSYFELEFDAAFVMGLKSLPKDWKQVPIPDSTRDRGRVWLNSGQSAILRIPSVIVPSEDNYVLNPAHPDFPKIKIGKSKKLEWDTRLGMVE